MCLYIDCMQSSFAQDSVQSGEKSSMPHDSIAYRPNFSSNNLK